MKKNWTGVAIMAVVLLVILALLAMATKEGLSRKHHPHHFPAHPISPPVSPQDVANLQLRWQQFTQLLTLYMTLSLDKSYIAGAFGPAATRAGMLLGQSPPYPSSSITVFQAYSAEYIRLVDTFVQQNTLGPSTNFSTISNQLINTLNIPALGPLIMTYTNGLYSQLQFYSQQNPQAAPTILQASNNAALIATASL